MRQFFSTLILFVSLITMTFASNADQSITAFHKHEITFGFYNDKQMKVNISHPPSPIFWTASDKANGGMQLTYLQMLYHTKQHFSAYWGASASGWNGGGDNNNIATLFVSMRFWLHQWHYLSPYFMASYAGPSLMSVQHFNGHNLGSHFIWQDYLGIGMMLGPKQNIDLNVRLLHYSNGDVFPTNPGFDVPIVVTVGFAF